jgi:DNA replication protein DnaC
MLTYASLERLIALGLTGMARALEEQRQQIDLAALDFEEWLARMIDCEIIERENKRLATRLKFARLHQPAVVEDVNLNVSRGLDKALFAELVGGDWIGRHQNLLIIGPTGVGKSFVACALGQKACRDNRSVLYHRLPRLFDTLLLARGDRRYDRLLKTLARVELLILDDLRLAPLMPEQGRCLLDVLDDRYGRTSTIVISQLPVTQWHELIGDPTIADAILDRLVHNAHRLILNGDSMRKLAAKLSEFEATTAKGNSTLSCGRGDGTKRFAEAYGVADDLEQAQSRVYEFCSRLVEASAADAAEQRHHEQDDGAKRSVA